MLEKVTHIAEQAATNVSRRNFLERLGRGAGVAAAALGGLLISSTRVQADRGGSGRCRRCYRRGLCCAFDGRRYYCTRCRR